MIFTLPGPVPDFTMKTSRDSSVDKRRGPPALIRVVRATTGDAAQCTRRRRDGILMDRCDADGSMKYD